MAAFPGKRPRLSAILTPTTKLGEHSRQVMAEVLGYDADRIAKLREAGIIFGG
jgi:crotonobetainyl-CoA:carnitine CoA-transferase CaiB-like acyl-CoA transferase